MPTFNDYGFGKAYQAEILRKAENERLVNQFINTEREHVETLNIKDRFLLSAGNFMISFGWKMKKASSCTYHCPEPNRA